MPIDAMECYRHHLLYKIRAKVVSIVLRLRAGRCGVRIPAGGDILSFLQNVQTNPVDCPASCLVLSGVIYLGQSGQGVKLAILLHRVPRIRVLLRSRFQGLDRDNVNLPEITPWYSHFSTPWCTGHATSPRCRLTSCHYREKTHKNFNSYGEILRND